MMQTPAAQHQMMQPQPVLQQLQMLQQQQMQQQQQMLQQQQQQQQQLKSAVDLFDPLAPQAPCTQATSQMWVGA